MSKEHIKEVKPKLDSVQKFLRKQVTFAEVEAMESGDDEIEEDVNYVDGNGFHILTPAEQKIK